MSIIERLERLIKSIAAYFDPNERCRKLDLAILWPECVRQAPTLDHAKAAFAVHAFNDSAWMSLGEAEVYRRIDVMEAP